MPEQKPFEDLPWGFGRSNCNTGSRRLEPSSEGLYMHQSNATDALLERQGASPPRGGTAIYRSAACLRHEMGSWHPECPERLTAIDDQLIASGVELGLDAREAPAASASDLSRVHPVDYLEGLQRQIPRAGYTALDPDTVMCPSTLEAATHAAGAALAATDAVINGEVSNAFCSIRPPGHHAGVQQAMGFCFINNVAVAARHAIEVHGLKRVAIVDFDVHHGNGTEQIFAGDERVLMASFFQHPFYPFSGTDHPAANMVNVPLARGSDGAAMRKAVTEVWLPALEAYRPEMVFISAGFDAHREDDLGEMKLIEADYVWLTEQILDIADRHAAGRIVSCLEGGYNLSALARSVVAHVRTLAAI
jgi:acetoin utilization deacetylase AcuC-like enzyme